MKKYPLFFAAATAVLGVFWFRSGTSLDSWSKMPTPAPETETSITASTSPDKLLPNGEATAVPVLASETVAEPMPSATRQAMLAEYWRLLLGDQRSEWCPSKRVDMFRELGRVMDMDVAEAKEHLDVLTNLEDVYWEDRSIFTTALISTIASKDPREALIYVLESQYEFENDDCEMVARMWMDAEGTAVMDWFDRSNLAYTKEQVAESFLTVFAEEDPHQFLLRYGNHPLNFVTNEAASLLYEDFGPAIYENLKTANLDSGVLSEVFQSIGIQISADDPSAAREWLELNQYTVDQKAVRQLAKTMLGYGVSPNVETALSNFEWAMAKGFVSSEDANILTIVDRMYTLNPVETRATLQRLQSKIGESAFRLLEMLPEPEIEEEEIFTLTPFTVDEQESTIFLNCFSSVETPSTDSAVIEQLVSDLRAKDPLQ